MQHERAGARNLEDVFPEQQLAAGDDQVRLLKQLLAAENIGDATVRRGTRSSLAG
jgi:hypothetical protein